MNRRKIRIVLSKMLLILFELILEIDLIDRKRKRFFYMNKKKENVKIKKGVFAILNIF
jgi:hypothetical protein